MDKKMASAFHEGIPNSIQHLMIPDALPKQNNVLIGENNVFTELEA